MEEGRLPYHTLVLVCTNKRAAGERVSCGGEGNCGAALRDMLKEEVARRGLKPGVRVSASGCLDVCEEGPNVLVSGRDGRKTLYSKVSPEDVPSLLASLEKI